MEMTQETPIGAHYKDGEFEEWAVSAYLANQDKTEYLIDGILPKKCHAMIYAPTGHMKTFMGIHIGCCVATGTPFNLQAVEPSEVVYIAAEAPEETAKRIKAWQEYHGCAGDVLRFVPTAFRFKDEESLAQLDRYLAPRSGKIGLVIFDTAARCASGVDEDNNSEVYQHVIDPLTTLKNKYGLTVLVIHHTGKDGRTPRGAAAWVDACDTVARIETTFGNVAHRDTPLYSVLNIEKMRGARPRKVAFRPVKQGTTLVLENATIDEAHATKPKSGRPRKHSTPRKDGEPRKRGREDKRDVKSIILLCLDEGIHTPAAMAERSEIPKKTIQNNLTELKNQGVVDTTRGEWRKVA
jgi:RecA-family ATPase